MSDGFFVIARLHRDDLKSLGFDTKNVSDEMMTKIAEDMGDTYVENDFWTALEIRAEDLDIPRL